MRERIKLKRDYYAGALMLVLGVDAAIIGSGYKFGTLARMGPGFMPVMLGVVLAPERFGRGAIEGVACPEASTHSSVQGDFIPTIASAFPAIP